MRILDIREATVPLSRYNTTQDGQAELTNSIVGVIVETDHGPPLVGFGFSSFGRYGQGGLMRERFIPRLQLAPRESLLDEDGIAIDPKRAWTTMMRGEKPGGHGERSVAVGTLDMALWDLAAKARGLPLWQLLARIFNRRSTKTSVQVYVACPTKRYRGLG